MDSTLTFVAHIKGLKKKCVKDLNLLRVVSNTNREGGGAQFFYGYIGPLFNLS